MIRKSLIRLFVDSPMHPDKLLTLSKQSGHYLGTVMRQRPGQEIAVFNGTDGEYTAVIKTLDRKSATIILTSQRRVQVQEPDLWLAFAPIKSARTDFIVEKATELGIGRLLPLKTERTTASRINRDRMTAHTKEAAEQSERLSLPKVDDLTPLMTFLDTFPKDRLLIFADESLEAPSVLQALLSLKDFTDASGLSSNSGRDATNQPHSGHKHPPACLLTGPEGGFSPSERKAIKKLKQTVAVHLGPRILRADTAVLAGLSIIQATIGDW